MSGGGRRGGRPPERGFAVKSGECPKCGSSEVRALERGNGLSLSTFSWVWLRTYICAACGYTESYVDPGRDREKVLRKAGPAGTAGPGGPG